MAMKCAQCGTRLVPGTRSCANCGQQFATEVPAGPGPRAGRRRSASAISLWPAGPPVWSGAAGSSPAIWAKPRRRPASRPCRAAGPGEKVRTVGRRRRGRRAGVQPFQPAAAASGAPAGAARHPASGRPDPASRRPDPASGGPTQPTPVQPVSQPTGPTQPGDNNPLVANINLIGQLRDQFVQINSNAQPSDANWRAQMEQNAQQLKAAADQGVQFPWPAQISQGQPMYQAALNNYSYVAGRWPAAVENNDQATIQDCVTHFKAADASMQQLFTYLKATTGGGGTTGQSSMASHLGPGFKAPALTGHAELRAEEISAWGRGCRASPARRRSCRKKASP